MMRNINHSARTYHLRCKKKAAAAAVVVVVLLSYASSFGFLAATESLLRSLPQVETPAPQLSQQRKQQPRRRPPAATIATTTADNNGGDDDDDKGDDDDSSSIAIFYNIYTPHKPHNFSATTGGSTQRQQQQQQQRAASIEQTAAIIEEQLDQIMRSHAFRAYPNNLTIHYTTVGLDPSSVVVNHNYGNYYDRLFRRRNLTAHHLAHYDAGYEEVTLQHLWEHCRRRRENNDDDATVVIYLHSKGSYHNDQINRNWRPHLLSAVTGDLCLEPWLQQQQRQQQQQQQECNVCGLQFYPVWAHLFPGNFFAAQCSYVRQLLPPAEFGARLARVSAILRQPPQPPPQPPPSGERGHRHPDHYFNTTIYMSDGWTWGAGRYAAEFWVGSHPDLVPCDVAEAAKVRTFMHTATAPRMMNFSYTVGAPRFPLSEQRHMLKRQTLLDLSAAMRDREYYLLAGNLVRWQMLYGRGAVPDLDRSWVWDYYPDGELWRELMRAMKMMTGDNNNNNNNATATAAAVLQKAKRDGHDEEWLRYLLSTKMLTTAS